jgi:hypothetical protein
MDMDVKIHRAGEAVPWEMRKLKKPKPAITRLRRAGTVSFDELMTPLAECHVTVTKKPRKRRTARPVHE